MKDGRCVVQRCDVSLRRAVLRCRVNCATKCRYALIFTPLGVDSSMGVCGEVQEDAKIFEEMQMREREIPSLENALKKVVVTIQR